MRCDDLHWLIAYAADELHFQGVVCDGRGDIYNKSANCPAVADLNVEWDFQSKTWRAEFVDGEFRGQEKCFSPSERTGARWEKCDATRPRLRTRHSLMPRPQLKGKLLRSSSHTGAVPSCVAITPLLKSSSALLSLEFRRQRWISAVADSAPQSRGTRRSRGHLFPIVG